MFDPIEDAFDGRPLWGSQSEDTVFSWKAYLRNSQSEQALSAEKYTPPVA